MSIVRLLLLSIVLLLAAAPYARADNWPEFRGPTGQGHVRGRLPIEWSATKNVVWKQAIPGVGWSSPIVDDGRIFLTAAIAVAGPNRKDQSLRALALDVVSGRILWDREVFRQDGSSVEALHDKASHANPTPITDGQRVYVHFGAQGTAALDRQGNVLWRNADLKYRQWHGNGGSPVLVDDLLIFNCDGADVQFIVALDRATGRVVWKTERNIDVERRYSYCTPLLIHVDGQAQLISPAAGAVMAYEPRTGKEIWRVRLDDGYSNVPRPVFGHGLVFVSNSTDHPHLLAIRPGGQGDVTATRIAWRMRRAVPLTSSPLLVGDELYMVSDTGVATCLQATTGKVHWRERLGGEYSASPLHADGKVYFQSDDGTATIIKAGPKFEVIARNQLDERVLASYAAVDGALLIRAEGHLYRISADEGEAGAIEVVRALGGKVRQDDQATNRPVTYVDLDSSKVTDADLQVLTRFRRLQKLYLSNSGVTGTGLSSLATLARLQTLDLRGSRVGDTALKELAALPSLDTLYLNNTAVTDAGLAHLSVLKNLQILNLRNTNVTDAGLPPLAALSQLQTLNLTSTKITDAGLKDVAALQQLTTLYLNVTDVTDAGLRSLAPLQRLHTINLRDTKVTDAGMKELSAFARLHTLYLTGTRVTDAGLAALAPLQQLQTLNLAGTRVTDAGLRLLSAFPRLETLYLEGARITDDGLTSLSRLKHLKTLDLSSTTVSDAGLNDLRLLAQLETLYLNATRVTDVGLHHLAGLRRLRHVDLRGTAVTSQGIAELQKSLPDCTCVR